VGCLLGGYRHRQRHRVGQADVLRGQDDQPAGDEVDVLPRLQHAGQPVDGGVGVAAAHALDQRRDDVVVHVAGPVVEQVPVLHRPLDRLGRDGVAGAERGGRLQRVERDAGVAPGRLQQGRHGLGLGLDAQLGQAAADHALQVVAGERLQPEDAAAREQRGDHLEGRVLGGGPDQRQRAVLGVGEDGVLLRLVEAMQLVHEEHGAAAGPAQLASLGHDTAQVGDAGGDRAQRHEPGAGRLGQDARERRLAGAGRAPQDDVGQVARLGEAAQRLHHLAVPDQVLESAGPDPAGQRRVGAASGVRLGLRRRRRRARPRRAPALTARRRPAAEEVELVAHNVKDRAPAASCAFAQPCSLEIPAT
jgi:hypothetical protein